MKRRRRVLENLRSADWWVWEILSLVVSAGALVTIVLLLSSLNDKPQPSWASVGTHCFSEPGIADIVCRQSGISVNSVVSWLGTLARLCLLVPLANCLGQLKWTWFGSRERSLADLDAFDAASRGLTGSLQLIWKLKARYIATLGATGIILSVAFDPFVQNLVGYYTKDVVDLSGLAFVANTSVYHSEGYVTNNYTMNGKGWTGDEPKYVASSCTLQPCIKSIKSDYDQSAEPPYREEILKTWYLDPSLDVWHPAGELQAPVEPEYGVNGENFTIEAVTASSIFYFIDTFSGVYAKHGGLDNTFASDDMPDSSQPDEIIFALWNGNYTECEYPDNRISCGLDLAARAMSKTMRDSPYDVNGTQGAVGHAYSPIVHIHVTWIWITLPACTWVLALVTFLATAWKSSQRTEHVWRNSTLPILFMILEEETVEQGERNTDVKALQQRATAIKGKVQIEDGLVKFAS
ncbi:hypothetical protein J4E90_010225 [Alternaria incomplexa]|uniref:uncharacterized protein n=1 Tax=Alternaria incomplexa TaxID=1187928 RepID=UPI00221E5576|nr:uncharacterized protein J4E90_010225 [Alternaria incomplexa]KAI4906766.1 hypothetical protein J4E90_010225 [Alternaria incomplexa]